MENEQIIKDILTQDEINVLEKNGLKEGVINLMNEAVLLQKMHNKKQSSFVIHTLENAMSMCYFPKEVTQELYKIIKQLD